MLGVWVARDKTGIRGGPVATEQRERECDTSTTPHRTSEGRQSRAREQQQQQTLRARLAAAAARWAAVWRHWTVLGLYCNFISTLRRTVWSEVLVPYTSMPDGCAQKGSSLQTCCPQACFHRQSDPPPDSKGTVIAVSRSTAKKKQDRTRYHCHGPLPALVASLIED
jgi:hypothetical protein